MLIKDHALKIVIDPEICKLFQTLRMADPFCKFIFI